MDKSLEETLRDKIRLLEKQKKTIQKCVLTKQNFIEVVNAIRWADRKEKWNKVDLKFVRKFIEDYNLDCQEVYEMLEINK